jgi:transmembrane sensor
MCHTFEGNTTMINENTYEFLAKYLDNECSQEERDEVLKWLNSDPSNLKVFQEIKETWQLTRGIQADFNPDLYSAWKKVDAGIQKFEKESKVKSDDKKQKIWPKVWRIAAVFIIGFSLFEIYSQFFENRTSYQPQIYTSIDRVGEVTLPDGSKVWINKGSKLEYPAAFTGDKREVSLSGEAFFEVTKDPSKPFIIKGSKTEVRVLGTSFVYRSFSEEESDILIVSSGKVSFSERKNISNNVTVESGFSSSFDSKTRMLNLVKNENKNYLSWKTGRLIFENERFERIIFELSRYYDHKFIIEDERMKDTRLTVAFDNQPVREALQILELALDKRFVDSSQVTVIK